MLQPLGEALANRILRIGGKPLNQSIAQSLLVVGSQAQGEYSFVVNELMSSSGSSKSYMSAFSSMRDAVTDFGKGTKPWYMSAGVLSTVRLRQKPSVGST